MLPNYLDGEQQLQTQFPYTMDIHHIRTGVLPHTHNFIEFTYVFAGEGVEFIDGEERRLEPGVLTFLMPYQVHELFVEPDKELSLYIGAIGLNAFFGNEATVLGLDELVFPLMNDDGQPLDGEAHERMLALMCTLMDEAQGGSSYSRTLFRAKLVEAFVTYVRWKNGRQAPQYDRPYPLIVGSRARGDIWRIVQEVYARYREDLTLEKLSEQFHLSVPTISSSFKQVTGENFHKFLDRIRIAHACSLLVSTNRSITEVAYETGFLSYASFLRAFSARMGCTPKVYRKRKR